MDLEYIDRLAELIRGSAVAEVTVTRGDRSVTLRREVGPAPAPAGLAPVDREARPALDSGAALPAPTTDTALVPVALNGEAEREYQLVRAHRVGFFHRGGAAGAEPLVRVGGWVAARQQLACIESMQLYDEIDCPVTGRVVGVFVADGSPVEYGQELFHLEVGQPPESPGGGDAP